ncbi:MAG: DUF4238 domain-containing protein [Coriobacteriia bacterium]
MSKKGGVPKKHHFIPCAHLTQFAEPNGVDPRDALIYEWDKCTGEVRRNKVRNVAYQKNLYRIPTEMLEQIPDRDKLPLEMQDELAWERMFSVVEGDIPLFAEAMQTHLALPPVGSAAMDNLMTWMFLSNARTPAILEEQRQLVVAFTNYYVNKKFGEDYLTKRFGENHAFDIGFKPNRALLLSHMLALHNDITGLLKQRNWSLRFSRGADYIISDNPMAWWFARKPDDPSRIPSPAQPQTLAMFPVTRKVLVTGEVETKSVVQLVDDDRWVGYYNTCAINRAARYFYTYDDHFVLMTNGERLPAYPAIYSSEEQVFTMTRQQFIQDWKNGKIHPPTPRAHDFDPSHFPWLDDIETVDGDEWERQHAE